MNQWNLLEKKWHEGLVQKYQFEEENIRELERRCYRSC
jgi:hypothetical protein